MPTPTAIIGTATDGPTGTGPVSERATSHAVTGASSSTRAPATEHTPTEAPTRSVTPERRDLSGPELARFADPAVWTADTRAALHDAGLDAAQVAAVVGRALAEDLAFGDDATTAATVPAGTIAEASFTPRSAGVLAGGPVARAVLDTVTAALGSSPFTVLDGLPDGATLRPGAPALRIRGPVTAMLTAERTALNLLCQLSGVATVTHRWVQAVAGTGARVRDTRKTVPGLRTLQKYAVRCGGGTNHRMGLGDAVLIKDNHVAAAGSVTAAIHAVRAARPDLPMQVEVDELDQLAEALAAGAGSILLDNFDTEQTAAAVRLTRAGYPGVLLESSGGLSLERAAEVAATGVDFLAVGALTHSAPALDIGLDIAADIAADTAVDTGTGAATGTGTVTDANAETEVDGTAGLGLHTGPAEVGSTLSR